AVPWILDEKSYVVQTPFSVESGVSFGCTANSQVRPLWVMNHFVYTNLSIFNLNVERPAPNSAASVNTRASIVGQANACGSAGYFPNFVTVDYYDVGDLFKAVADINGVTYKSTTTNTFGDGDAGSTTSAASVLRPAALVFEVPSRAIRACVHRATGSPIVRPLSIVRTESPERSQSFSAPTSPFRPQVSSVGSIQQRARTFGEPGFGGHETKLPLLAAPLAQQMAQGHQRTQSSYGVSYSAACSPRELARRSSIAVGAGVGSRRSIGVGSVGVGSRGSIAAGSDDDDDDDESVALIGSDESSLCDGDIDGDSMALDDTTNDAGSSGGAQLAGLRRQSVGSAPRNKAVVRLMSLVEEDRKPLASEMEHEGHITRSIRHSSVQEWLRSSTSSPAQPSPPTDTPSRAPKPCTHIQIPPTSSPQLLATGPSSCPNSACIVPAVSLGKRKSLDESEAQGEPSRGSSYKRMAMSPSGLRAQVTFSKVGARRVPHVPRSGPSSPLLTSRPMLASSAGTCPPVGATRSRSRSGASLVSGPN
ncbi:hypothetical protein GGH14_005898, partial [Coemansia sp. RSA 370]